MHSKSHRDPGMTLIETIVTIAMIGLIATVIGASITVIFRTKDGVRDVVAESHDVQQAVNYFHLDVESGPPEVSGYKYLTARGSGCSNAGNDNLLRFDTDPDGDTSDPDLSDDRRIAYRLATNAGVGELDRYECKWMSGAWAETSVVNVADQLDATGGPAATITMFESSGLVDRIELTFAQSNLDRDVAASPRAETGNITPVTIGTCSGNPLAPALGFGNFVEGDVYLDNTGATVSVEGSMAIGGDLGWRGSQIDALTNSESANNFGGPPLNKLGLYAVGVDWSYGVSTNAILSVGNNTAVLPPSYVAGGNPNLAYENGPPGAGAHVRAKDISNSAGLIDFSAQFGQIQDCADALANLPAGANAAHVNLTYSNGNRDIDISATGGAAMVLNIPEANLSTIENFTISSPLSNPKPLIINISEDPTDGDDDIVFDTAVSWTNFGDYKRVIYNFVNLTGTVIVDAEMYGTIYSAYAPVITNEAVHGAVVATHWTHTNGLVENGVQKVFNATINWTP